MYKRVVTRSKRFYAHDEQGTAHLGDFVKIEETRPLSKLKRWQLKEIVQRAAQVAPVENVPDCSPKAGLEAGPSTRYAR